MRLTRLAQLVMMGLIVGTASGCAAAEDDVDEGTEEEVVGTDESELTIRDRVRRALRKADALGLESTHPQRNRIVVWGGAGPMGRFSEFVRDTNGRCRVQYRYGRAGVYSECWWGRYPL